MRRKNKTFDEILAELDELIKADFVKFREDLKRLSIQEKMDDVFENSENNINLADELLYQPIEQDVSQRFNHDAEVTVTSRQDNA
jgi:hypothetical protein